MRAVTLWRLALAYQRGMEFGEHPIDARMRMRAWLWWSEAQDMGIVLG